MDKQFNAMKENATFKEMAQICEKYGYILERAFIRKYEAFNQKIIEIGKSDNNIFSNGITYKNDFMPESDLEKYYFSIQTTSYGALKLEEYKEFLQAQQNALQLVEELEKLDLSTLYTIE